jgi:hypothetical protein
LLGKAVGGSKQGQHYKRACYDLFHNVKFLLGNSCCQIHARACNLCTLYADGKRLYSTGSIRLSELQ